MACSFIRTYVYILKTLIIYIYNVYASENKTFNVVYYIEKFPKYFKIFNSVNGNMIHKNKIRCPQSNLTQTI